MFGEFTAIFLPKLIKCWLAETTVDSPLQLRMHTAFHTPYFRTWLDVHPGRARELLISQAQKIINTPWTTPLPSGEQVREPSQEDLKTVEQMSLLARLFMLVGHEEGPLPQDIAEALTAKCDAWNNVRLPENLSPPNSVKAVKNYLRQDLQQLTGDRARDEAGILSIRRCNFTGCTVEGKDRLSQCSKCKSTRYVSQQSLVEVVLVLTLLIVFFGTSA